MSEYFSELNHLNAVLTDITSSPHNQWNFTQEVLVHGHKKFALFFFQDTRTITSFKVL